MSPTRVALAWAVHLFTGLGLPLALLAFVGLLEHNASLFFTSLFVAAVVDAVDGTFARKVGVKEVLPNFNGRKLDDLIDFLNFAFLPCAGLIAFSLFPPGWGALAAIPLMASGYGFCQESAKTEEAFVGFPSYWNILVLYFYVAKTAPWAAALSTVLFSILVFVPLHYLYPTKAPFLQKTTFALGLLWSGPTIAIALHPDAPWSRDLALLTLYFPIYYLIASLVHHWRVHRGEPT